MTARLKRLERAGLVERVANPEDGRSVRVALSVRGKTVVDALVGPHLTAERTLLDALSTAEQRALTRLLRKLTHSLESAEP